MAAQPVRDKIRERKKGATPEDFDRIGTEFHRWVRDTTRGHRLKQLAMTSTSSSSVTSTSTRRQYLRLMEASQQPVAGPGARALNAQHGFTLQYMVLLAPLRPDDSDDVAVQKIAPRRAFLDILLALRMWNFRSIAYSTMQYAMFLVMRTSEGSIPSRSKLREILKEEETLRQQRKAVPAPAEPLVPPPDPRPHHGLY